MSKAPLLYGLGCVTGGCVSYLTTSWYHDLWGKKPAPAPTPTNGTTTLHPTLSKYGVPVEDHVNTVGDVFATGSNWMTRCPSWTMEHLTPEGIKGEAGREHSSFKAAQEVPEPFRATPADYKTARQFGNYVRGHMVPAADMKASQEAMDATFILNHNVVPQDGVCNSAAWLGLESLVRKAAKKQKHTWSLTGPVFKPQFNSETGQKEVTYSLVGAHDVAVPTHLFKVILSEGSDGSVYTAAFLVPNSPCDEAPIAYKVKKEEIERLTGLQLFDKLDAMKGVKDLCGVEKCTDKARAFGKKKEE